MKNYYKPLKTIKNASILLLFFLTLGANAIAQTFTEVENNNTIGVALASSQDRIYGAGNVAGTISSSESDFWVISRKADQATQMKLLVDAAYVGNNGQIDFRVWEYTGGNWGVSGSEVGTLRTSPRPNFFTHEVDLNYQNNLNGSGVSDNYYAIEVFSTSASVINYSIPLSASSLYFNFCYEFSHLTPTALQVNDADVTLNNLTINGSEDRYYIVKFSATNSFTDFTDHYIQDQALPTAAASNSYSGSGEHIAYVGTDNGAIQAAMTMTNLQRNTTYYYKIYPYNNCQGYINYNNSIASVAITTCPGTAPNTGSVNSVSPTSPTTATINTLGRPAGADADMGYIVKFSDTNSFTAPSGATLPPVSTDYSGKTGEQVVYTGAVGNGAGTTDDINQVITGLQINTEYYVKVYTYDLCGGTYNYDTTGSAVVTTNYVCAAPSSAVTNVVTSVTGATTIGIDTFTPPSNASQGTLAYIVKVSDVNLFTTPTSVPSSSSTVYNAVTGGEQVMYVGSSAAPNISVSGLISNGTYYIKVYAYNTCAGSEYFETTGSTAVSVKTCGAPVGNSELNAFREDLHWETRVSPIISNVPVGVEGQVVKINIENTFTDITGALNTLPTADVNYSGSGEQVVLAGAFPEGQAFTAQNLLPNTQYFFKIYSYTECAGVYYFSNTSDAISTYTPGVTDKLASNAVIDNYTGTAFTLASFIAAPAADNGLGIPKGYIVKMNTVNSFTPHGFRGPIPTPDADYKGGEQVMYVGSSVTPNQVITGLTPDITYYFTIYAYNDSGAPYFINSYQQTGYEFSVVNNGSLLIPTITFDDVTVNAGAPNFNLNATSDPSGGISYRMINDGGTGTTLSGTNNETVTVGSAGTVIIEALRAATATHQVAAKTMTLTITAPLATLGGGIAYEVNSGPTTLDMTTTISSNSTGAYTFEIIGGTLGYTINGNLLNLNNVAGSIVIKVTQAADANYSETVAFYSTAFYNAGFSPKTDIAHNLFDFSLNPGESHTIITAQNLSSQTTTYSIVNDGGTGSTLIGNVFTAGGAGTVILRAFTPDDFLYNATTTDVTVTINGTPQTITFNPLSDVTYGDAAFDLTATASSGLVVSYASSDPTIASISGSTVTIHKDGTVNITASQAGGGVYDPAPDVIQPLTVNPITLVNQNVALNTTGSGLCSTTATVSLDNTQSNVDYYLRNNSDNTIIEGPVAGTGSGISFASEVLTANRTYNVMAVQGNQTLPSATNTLLMSGTPMASVQALDAKTINLTQPDGASAIVSVASSQSGISYYLQDNTTNEVLQGPLTGTGSDVSFASDAITADKTYKVVGTDATANHGIRTVLRLDNVDDYVSIPAISSHLSNTQQATIETWVKIPAADATDINASIISFEGYSSFFNPSVTVVPFYINISGGTIFAGHYDNDVDDGGAYNTPGYTYPIDTWFHVAATMNGPAINFYVNGNLIGSTGIYSGFEFFQLSSNIRLGRNYESTSNSSKLFGGALAQTRIWNGIRTQTEITSTMNTQFTTPQTGLVLNYNYDQTSGTTVSDASGNTNTGTLQNGAGDATNWVSDLFTDSVCGFVPMSNTVTATHSATQSQTITFNSLTTKSYGDATFDLTATSDSGLPVSYVSSDTSVATISGTTVTIVGAGTTTITASQAGDATYTPAIDVAQDLTVSKRNIEITANAVSRAYGDTDNLTYQITSGSLVSGDALTGSLTRVAGEDVGTYAINQGTLSAGGSYNITFVSNDLTITQRAIEVTADAKTKIYGDADPALTYQITSGALQGSDAFTGNLNRITGDAVGTYAINQGSLALSSNYILTFISDDLSVTARAIEVTTDAKTKIYGDADPALTYQITSGVLQGSDAFTGTVTRVAGEIVGTYAINQGSLALSSNYTLTFVSDDLSITARAIEVTADAKTKEYGDADPTLTYQVTSGVLQGSDAFTGAVTRVTGEAVGTYAINQGTLALNSNYNLSFVSSDFEITKATVAIVINDLTQTYDGTTKPVSVTTIPNGLTVDVTYDGGTTVPTNAGNYAVVATINDTNYQGTSNETLTINKADQVITFGALSGATYGDVFNVTATSSSGLPVSFASSDTSVATISGNEVTVIRVSSVSIIASQAGNSNYNAAPNVSQSLGISRKDLTVRPDVTTIEYGLLADASASIPVIVSGFVNGDTVNDLSGTGLANVNYFDGSTTPRNVGNYVNGAKVNITGAVPYLSSNYNFVYTFSAIEIVPREVTITANAGQSKAYGDTDPTLAYTMTPLPTTGTSLYNFNTFALSGNLARVAGENVGTYAINQGTLDATTANYNVTFVSDNFEITERAIEITADAKNKTYGDADPALTYQITSGVLQGSDTFTGDLSRVAGEDAGTYAINQGTLGINSNYAITFVSDDLTIAQRAIEVTADAKSKIYGDADPAFTYTITGGSLAGSDTFTGTLDRAAGQAQGNYAIQQGTLSPGGNYNLTFVPGNLYIDYRFIRIVPSGIQKTYGDPDPAFNVPFTITTGSLAFDDTVEVVGTFRDAGENVGGYQIRNLNTQFTSTNGGQSSYNVSFMNAPSARLLINPRVIEVTADTQAKTYGDADPTLSYQVTNGALQFSDTFTGSLTRVVGEAVGTYAINQGSLSAGSNYTLSYVGDDLTIGQRAITITADDQVKIIGAADPALTYQITNGALQFSDAITGSLTRVAGETLGDYAINQGSLSVNGNYNLTFVAGNLTITDKIPQTITFNALTDRQYGDADFSLTATGGASGNAITYVSSNTAVATISGNVVTIVGVGNTTITASQAGNATYANAIDVPQSLTVNKGDQTITFNALPNVTIDDVDFNLTATASSGLAVTYVSSDPTVATVTGNVVSIVGLGTATITASQAGDTNWNAATDVLQSLTVVEACPLVNLSADNFQIQTSSETCTDKNNGSITIAATSSQNYTTTINGQAYSFTETLTVDNLTPGTYPICIAIDGFSNCERCFEAVIEAASVLAGKTEITSGIVAKEVQVNIESGTAPYTVMINDEVVGTYATNSFSVSAKNGDTVEVTSSIACEGKLSKSIVLGAQISVYPNPTRSDITLSIPDGRNIITVTIHNTLGTHVLTKTYAVIDNKVIIPMSAMQAGVYFVQVSESSEIIKIIKE